MAALAGKRCPRILIHYTALNRGGAENSLLRFMSGMARRGCEVHLVLTVPGGELEASVDERVIVHHLRSMPLARRMVRNTPLSAFGALLRRLRGFAEQRREEKRLRGLEFDAAFVGRAGMPHDFVCRVANARKRFVFVRSDPEVDVTGRWGRMVRKYHKSVDNYICVSRFVKDGMARKFPGVSGKLVTIYNLLEPQKMIARVGDAADPFATDARVPRVLSVCRLQERQKELVRMVEVHKRLLEKGVVHEWFVLGDGPDRKLLENAILGSEVQESFRVLGAVSNPFPYYHYSDVVAVLSRYEGLCGVVNEARVLKRPVIATRFSGIDEQLVSGVNGLVVEQDIDSIVDGLQAMIRDPELRYRLANAGYPAELLDDERKIDQLLELTTGSRAEAARFGNGAILPAFGDDDSATDSHV